MDKIELLGGACFSHGPYTFYKAVRIGNGRVLRLGSFFLTKLWTDADLVSIGELQLLWLDSRGSNQPLASLRLYFLPENTPDGRRNTHGEDEVLTISEKVVVRVHDLVSWLSPSLEWSWGREVSIPPSPTESSSTEGSPQKLEGNHPQVLTDPGIDFTDVEKQQKDFETNLNAPKRQEEDSGHAMQPRVVVLSYPRYCRYRALLRRLEGAEPSWFSSSIAAALGGFTALPGTKVLFCRDTFDYPDLETHELLCNHLAPKLKGRPRRKRKKRSASPGESSNESEASVASISRAPVSNLSLAPALRPPSGVRRSERNTCGEEKRFLTDVHSFMRSRGTPVGKMPLLGYRQIDLFLFYTKVQKLGGYDTVSGGRLWKSIYDDIGGNVGSTSAATITRRHYERLLLPYERHQRGEETKVRPAHGRRLKCRSLSGDSIEPKPEIGRISTSETPPPPEASTVASPVPPLQSILSSTPFLPGEKPKTEGGKTSSLRSVRVKPERLKSLNTIIANSTPVVNQNSSQLPSPSPPPSSNASSSSASTSENTPSSTPSTTPTSGGGGAAAAAAAASIGGPVVAVAQSVLERQLNSPLICQQVPPASTSPPAPSLPVIAVTTHSTAIVTLTPPPEKDTKEMKLDPKATSLLAQGKENIPIFGEKPIFTDKSLAPPKSPEVIDLEMENDASRDKIVIPSFKKRKLEILREGGLEVTAVDLDARPSVIQATIVPVTTVSGLATKIDEANGHSFSAPATTPNSVPKLISVTVTPDIGHMFPTHQDQSIVNGNSPVHPQTRPPPPLPHSPSLKSSSNRSNLQASSHQLNKIGRSGHLAGNNNNNNNNAVTNNNGSSRVINVGSPSNASLLQLYASATNAALQPNQSSSPPVNHRFVPPSPTNDRQATATAATTTTLPPKVTQSRSIFAHNEKVVYGNPKDILIPQNYHRSIGAQHQQAPHSGSNSGATPSAILDLTQKQVDRSFARPNLEIVRVPVVPRTNPLNLDTKSSVAKEKLQEANSRKTAAFTGYAGMLDTRTMASNNLEITLVSPKHRAHPTTPPQLHQRSASPPITRLLQNNSNSNVSNSPSNTVTSQQRRHQNGKYPSRLESLPQYASRKPSHQPIIPNIPNLHNLNNSGFASSKSSAIHRQQQQPPQQQAQQRLQKQEQEQSDQQQMLADSRKTSGDSGTHDQPNNHQRRISESDKTSIVGQQQQQQPPPQQHKANSAASSRQQHTDSSRRHSAPNPGLPSGFVGTPPQNSPGFLAQLPNTATKFLPMLDPLYYSAFYNGLFPSPVPPTSQPYIPPEFSAYYKELLASSQPRLAMAGQHQPAVPTSK